MTTDDKTPATKADVAAVADDIDNLAQATKAGFDKTATKDDLAAMEQRLNQKFATKEQTATVLAIVTSIDEQLKEWKGIPAKVERLHKRIFPHR